MKLLSQLLLFTSLTFPLSSFAALGDHPIILIHGFQAGQLQTKPNHDAVIADGKNYWQDYWLAKADDRIDWPSQERVAGKISTDYIWPKLQELSKNNTCKNGCILVTHSTGDLVARHLLDNQENWLTNAGLTPLKIIATFDFAGAGGGSELGDLAINISEGSGYLNAPLKYAMSLWLGEVPSPKNTGVLNDLKVANARQIAALPDNRIPRIRFVGKGSDYVGSTSPFLLGKDDGVVASHSSCGASEAGNFNSCSINVAFDGKLSPQANAVTQFMPFHYPMLMGDDYSHSGLISSKHQGKITAVNPTLTLQDGSVIKVETTDSAYWLTGNVYRYVNNSENATMSELVSELL
ncbi:hypothetical protein [Aliivibrio fischeri]|uniref:hypothetical protein n=1 Tax=Aliivibrio fischeri TaxID=668 RepID=UPI0007C43560|nr:hypothetical protein [Aliivibrio fischeri]